MLAYRHQPEEEEEPEVEVAEQVEQVEPREHQYTSNTAQADKNRIT